MDGERRRAGRPIVDRESLKDEAADALPPGCETMDPSELFASMFSPARELIASAQASWQCHVLELRLISLE